MDSHYPTVDIKFMEDSIERSAKILANSKKRVGKTTMYVMDGVSAISKRMILLRPIQDNEVHYEQAIGIAIKLNFLVELMDWFEVNKHWKDGAYVVAPAV